MRLPPPRSPGVVPAAADEVSALTAAQFALHAQMYQAVSAQAAAIHRCLRPPWARAPVRMRPLRPVTRSRPAENQEIEMDFGALPPEINSGRMYSGPGSAPMLAAAAGWDQLSRELYSAAASYYSVISGLTGGGC